MSLIRDLRAAVADAVAWIGVEVHDVLPDHLAGVAAIVVGMPELSLPSDLRGAPSFRLDVTVVAERADFHDAQVRLDDVVWDTFVSLSNGFAPGFELMESVTGAPTPVESAGQTFPGYSFTLLARESCTP